MPAVESSNIARVDWDQDSEVLTVEFNGGSTYEYEGVPEQVYTNFLGAASKGRFFHQFIKGQYAFTRVG